MIKMKRCFAIFIIACSFCSHPAHGEYELIDSTIAFVGEKVILESDLDNYACYEGLKTKKPASGLNKRDLLERLIDEIVLFQEAVKTGMGNGERTDVASRMGELKRMMDENGLFCDHHGFDDNYIAEMIRREETVSEFIRNRVEIFVKIAERDVHRYYISKHGGSEEGYNEEVKVKYQAELKQALVEKELANFLARIKKRIKIVIPED